MLVAFSQDFAILRCKENTVFLLS